MQIKKYVFKVATTYNGDWYEEQEIVQYEESEAAARSRLQPELERIVMSGHALEDVKLIEEMDLNEIPDTGNEGVGC